MRWVAGITWTNCLLGPGGIRVDVVRWTPLEFAPLRLIDGNHAIDGFSRNLGMEGNHQDVGVPFQLLVGEHLGKIWEYLRGVRMILNRAVAGD
jgi:hypothetical protein